MYLRRFQIKLDQRKIALLKPSSWHFTISLFVFVGIEVKMCMTNINNCTNRVYIEAVEGNAVRNRYQLLSASYACVWKKNIFVEFKDENIIFLYIRQESLSLYRQLMQLH